MDPLQHLHEIGMAAAVSYITVIVAIQLRMNALDREGKGDFGGVNVFSVSVIDMLKFVKAFLKADADDTILRVLMNVARVLFVLLLIMFCVALIQV